MNFSRKHVICLAIIAALALLIGVPYAISRTLDKPPTIEFTWIPEYPETLSDVKATLHIVDDNAIDFTSYRFTMVELDKTIDYPVPGVVGRDFEQPVSLSLIASDPRLADKKQITIRIKVADDQGQESTLEKVIKWTK